MDGERIERAVQRIETALGRIAKVADAPRPTAPSASSLVAEHERLRETVGDALRELDGLIERLER